MSIVPFPGPASGLSLSDSVTLVTGAGGGIGRAICTALRAAGATVIATDIAPDPGGIDAHAYIQHDVSREEDWARVARAVEADHGRLDALVNNAAISIVASIADTSLAEWRRVQSINVEGILLGLQAFCGLLRKGGEGRVGGASVVNLSSVGGLRGAAFNAAYCSSKGAVTLLTKSAAVEYGALGWPIRVNSVHPGGIDTDMMGSILQRYVDLGAVPSVEVARSNLDARHPAGRMGQPAEIAAGIAFLCSPAASFMTGSELVIDGGFTAL